jgi:protein ImuA
MPQPAIVRSPLSLSGRHNVVNGASDDEGHQVEGTPGALLKPFSEQTAPDQTGFPADRFAYEDDGAFPRTPHPASSSSSFAGFAGRPSPATDLSPATDRSPPIWTLDGESAPTEADIALLAAASPDITRLALDTAGVHELKPAFSPAEPGDGPECGSEVGSGMEPRMRLQMEREDWAASWSAARAFCLALTARRIASNVTSQTIQEAARRPVLWCLPRTARAEHGVPNIHGLQHLGITSADILLAETGNTQDTLWTLEEGLKSDSAALVVGVIDDVELTPARRLALAAKKHGTPCLLLTHPRMPPVAATATRWRVAARPSAQHPLSCAQHPLSCASHPLRMALPSSRHARQSKSPFLKAPGARRFALTLERCRMAPRYVTGREVVVEWSDEAFCLRMVANLSNRSHAARQSRIGAAR